MKLVNYSLEEITQALNQVDANLLDSLPEARPEIQEAHNQAVRNYRKLFNVHLSEIRMS